MARKVVPLVIYQENGKRKVVGKAEVDETGLYVSASITDPELAKTIFTVPVSLSVSEDEEIIRLHNVFDKDKD